MPPQPPVPATRLAGPGNSHHGRLYTLGDASTKVSPVQEKPFEWQLRVKESNDSYSRRPDGLG
jgi:hypothetical protein